MTKSELIYEIGQQTNLPRGKAEAAVNAVFKTISRELGRGNQVSIIGFGTFLVSERKARKGTNPRTGEPIDLPASKLPCLRAGKSLKQSVNKVSNHAH